MADDFPKAGVIGWPVAHSLSPHIHRHWLQHYGIGGSYELIPVPPQEVEARIRGLGAAGYVGANVTVPHKLAALAAADRVTETARRIGAVNTLYYEEGQLVGENSDAAGFHQNILAAAADWEASSGPVVLLGAGGAARALVVALLDAGAPEIRLANRTLAKSEELAAAFGDRVRPWPWEARGDALAEANLLVNSTSLGMVGQAPLKISLERLPPGALVNDIVYRPLETGLLAAAKARGNPVVDGLGMLLHQAVPGFHRWFGRKPEVTAALRAIVLKAANSEKTESEKPKSEKARSEKTE